MSGGLLTCPEDVLAREIELAVAYTVACNRDRLGELLLTPPQGCRAQFSAMIAGILAERAGKGLSGMTFSAPEPAEGA